MITRTRAMTEEHRADSHTPHGAPSVLVFAHVIGAPVYCAANAKEGRQIASMIECGQRVPRKYRYRRETL